MSKLLHQHGQIKITPLIPDGTIQHSQPITANSDNTKAQPHPELSELTDLRSSQLNTPFKHSNGNDRSKSNGTNNLLLQLDEKHPRFQELLDINDHLVQDSNPATH